MEVKKETPVNEGRLDRQKLDYTEAIPEKKSSRCSQDSSTRKALRSIQKTEQRISVLG